MELSLNKNNKNLVTQQKIDFLIRNSVYSVFTVWVLAALLVAILIDQVTPSFLFDWFKVISLTVAFRLFVYISYTKTSPKNKTILFWMYPYFIGVLSSTFSWGLGAYLVLPLLTVEYQLVVFFYLVLISAGIQSIYSSFWYFVIASTYSVLAPTTWWFFNYGDKLHFNVAASATVLMVIGILSSKKLSLVLHNQIVLFLELQRAKEKADTLARNDFLTGINNRLAFTELSNLQLDYCRRHRHPAALIIMDVDYFKKINDTYGHSTGDRALIIVAKVLHDSIRSSDVCGRIGGEEFAIFLANANKNDALNVAEKIRRHVESEKMGSAKGEFNLTVSVGVCTQIDDLEVMMNKADQAMYQAKQQGRNQVALIAENEKQIALI